MAKHYSAFFLFSLQSFLTVSSVLLLKNHQNHNSNNNNAHHRLHQTNQSSCDLFTGSWIHDNSFYPSYQSSCSVIDPQFNCLLFGRPDTTFLNYRWQPDNCQIPRFDGVEFLTKMRGKSMMFVGDSIGRSQYESLICMIMSSGLSTSSPTEYNRGDTFSTFKFLEYGVTISYYKATYLVDIDAVQGRRVLKLDEIRGNANAWVGFDVLSFNTGHWWTHTGSSQGWDLMESEGTMYQDMDRLVALERALRTWAKWIDNNVDTSKTRVFFQGISPTHENPSVWNTGTTSSSKNCYGETMPITNMPGAYSDDQMKVTQEVLSSMNSPPFLLDITLLSAMRKDAHPSIYSGDLTPGQRASPDRSADCSHWCLPGLPDTWNQLFYTAFFYLHY